MVRHVRVSARPLAAAAVWAVLAGAPASGAADTPPLELDGTLKQGGLVIGRTSPGAEVRFDGRPVRVSADGVFLIGFHRDESPSATLAVRTATTLCLDLLVLKPLAVFVWWFSQRANTLRFERRAARDGNLRVQVDRRKRRADGVVAVVEPDVPRRDAHSGGGAERDPVRAQHAPVAPLDPDVAARLVEVAPLLVGHRLRLHDVGGRRELPPPAGGPQHEADQYGRGASAGTTMRWPSRRPRAARAKHHLLGGLILERLAATQ